MGLILGSGTTTPQYPYNQWYGVQGDYSSTDEVLTRVGNLDLHRTLPVHSKMRRFVENTDGSVKYYLHQNDSRKKDSGAAATLDSTDGNVMLELPEHYFRFEVSGTKWIAGISEYPLPGFVKIPRRTISPWGCTVDNVNNKVVSGSWLTWSGDAIARDGNGLPVFAANAAQFRGCGNSSGNDGTAASGLGMCRTSISRTTMRGYCQNGTHVGAGRAYNTIKWFFRIEYARMNCQAAYNATLTAEGYHQGGLGQGTAFSGSTWNTHNGYTPFIPCGVTATLGNNTGLVEYVLHLTQGGTQTFNVQSYRGFEVPFEYIWLNADDILIHHSPDTGDALSVAYVCDDPTLFTTPSNSQTAIPTGYVAKTTLPRSSMYVKYEDTDGAMEVSLPSLSGGSAGATTGTCDYFYHPGADADGWYAALFGGAASDGTDAGFGSLDTHRRPTSTGTGANIGFRLCRN